MKNIKYGFLVILLFFAEAAFSETKKVPDCFTPSASNKAPGTYFIGYTSDEFGEALVADLQRNGLTVSMHLKSIDQVYVKSLLTPEEKQHTLAYLNKLVLHPEITFIECGGGESEIGD